MSNIPETPPHYAVRDRQDKRIGVEDSYLEAYNLAQVHLSNFPQDAPIQIYEVTEKFRTILGT